MKKQKKEHELIITVDRKQDFVELLREGVLEEPCPEQYIFKITGDKRLYETVIHELVERLAKRNKEVEEAVETLTQK